MSLDDMLQNTNLYHQKKNELWEQNLPKPMYGSFDANQFNSGQNYVVQDNQAKWGIVCNQNTGNPLGQVKGPFG